MPFADHLQQQYAASSKIGIAKEATTIPRPEAQVSIDESKAHIFASYVAFSP